jgi:hypothetical protein
MALPCIVCGAELRNVMPDHNNQPRGGVAAFTSGNYGSAVFDSLDGETLEFTVCDTCLVHAGERGRVVSSYPRRPVLVEGRRVGWESMEPRPVPWHVDLPGRDDACSLDLDELDNLPPTIALNFTPTEIRAMVAGLTYE